MVGYVFRQLEADLDAATHYKSPSPSPPAVTSSPESAGSRSHTGSTSPRLVPSGSHAGSASPRPVPGGSRASSSSPGLVPGGQPGGDEGGAGGGEGVEPAADGDGEMCQECEWGGVKYSIGEVVYARPR